jgi:pimeloyl-ACP methyl ester carboxylesterase
MNKKWNTTDLMKYFLFLGLCLITQSIFAQDSTESVTIDSTKFNIKLGGLEHIKDSVPVVVLEMGAGSSLKSWEPIYNELIKFAPVFAYERAGIGQSEWNDIEPTPFNVANQLKKILSKLDLKPPYILAGHSWGGVIIRAYAGHFKEDVKALVYIDPMDYTMTTEDEKSIYKSIGTDPEDALKFIDELTEFFTGGQEMPPGITAEYDAIDKFNKTEVSKRQLGEEPNIPMAIFIGTKAMPAPPVPPQFKQPFDYEEWFKASIKQRVASLSSWTYDYSDEGYLFISPNATHFFHFGEPEMVIKMIEKFTK